MSRDGRTITGRFQCGGHLEVDETDRTVTLTFIAASVARGAMACALVPLFAHLDAPIGSRTLVDGVNGQRLHFIHEPHPVK